MKTVPIITLLLCSLELFARVYTVDTVLFHSSVLNSSREVYINIPENLGQADSVTFLYIPDGMFSSYFAECVSGANPTEPTIVVAINADRRNDLLYVRNASKYLEFITNELVAEIEKPYKVKNRTMFGHSLGGGFVVYACNHHNGIFSRYVASSPTPIMALTDVKAYQRIDSDLKNEVYFFFSYGSEDMRQVKKWCVRLQHNLSAVSFEHIHWKGIILEGENHHTASRISLINGIHYGNIN